MAATLEGDARACGGCFHPPTQVASDITDERMLLSVSSQQTTLYDQISYSGNPTSFAWVLPIHGTVDVGLSADVLFDSVDAVTATTITPPASSCPSAPAACNTSFANAATGGAASPAAEDAGVAVLKQQNVGPYETVQLHATDSSAINAWLAQNGFVIPADVTPVLDEYVAEGFDFLAMKLLPDQGIQAMRPVRVTTPGASVSLPLRMAAVGTGATVGITLWVVADGRYEPQNFPFFHIDDSELVWDFSLESSNYTTLRTQKEAALGGKGWEIESSIDVNQALLQSVILNGGYYYGGGGYGYPTGATANASDDYLPVYTTTAADGGTGDDGGGAGLAPSGDAGIAETADQVRTDDIAALFAGMSSSSVRITRIRSDIAHAAMNVDFVLAASADQSELSNVRDVTNAINETCSVYSDCTITGTGTPAQAQASVNQANANLGDGSGGMVGADGGCKTAPTKTTDTRSTLLALGFVFAFVFVRHRVRRSGR